MYSKKNSQNTYNLQVKSKCISNANGTLLTDKYNLHYFFISSNVPFVDNEIHLVEYNDQTCCVRNVNIFKGKGEIKQMTCIDSFTNDQKKNVLMLCTSGNDTTFLNRINQNEDEQNGIEKNLKERTTKESCFVWTGQLDNLGEETDADTNTDTEADIEVDEVKTENDNEMNRNRNKEEEEEENDKMVQCDKEEEVKVETKKKKNNNENENENEYGEKLVKLCELESDRTYNNIKKIATDNYEKVISKIVIIDKYSYNLFEKEQMDIHFVQSKKVNTELNYGTLDPHHPNVLTLISDAYLYGYDLKSNKNIFSTFTNHKSKLSAVDFNPNIPNVIGTASYDGYIKLWDLRFLKNSFFSINAHSHWITSINFNNFHDELLLTTGTDFSVKLHKIEYRKNFNFEDKKTYYQLIKQYKDHEESVLQGIWSNTDAWVFASISYDGKCVINTVPEKQKYKILL